MLTVNNLTKSYVQRAGRHFVFRDLSFVVPEGKSVALLGPNGAGKSTLLRVLSGAENPDAGSVAASGPISWPVGLAGGFHPTLSAHENCRFVLRVHGCEGALLREKLAWIREFSEIHKFFDFPVSALSSGMRSRVAFALSMSLDFAYYLIDEITAVGDAAFRDKSKQTLLGKKRSGSAFIIATHNLQEAIAVADCGLVIHQGKVSYYDSVHEAADAYRRIAFPDSVYVKKLLEKEQVGALDYSSGGPAVPPPVA